MSTATIANTIRNLTAKPIPWLRPSPRWKRILPAFPFHRRSERLSGLIARYETLPDAVRSDPANQRAIQLIEKARAQERPSWSDLANVEHALLCILPPEDLKEAAWGLRDEFRQTIASVPANQSLLEEHDAFHPQAPVASTDTEVRSLRAYLIALQGKLHKLGDLRRDQIRARNSIALLTIALSAITIFITLQLDKLLNIKDTIVFDVFGVGMLGGVFSTFLRIQKFKVGGNYDATALTSPGNQAGVMLSPAIGGIGAVVLFVILAAGFLNISIFPALQLIKFGPESDALEDLFKTQLPTSAEAAKLYVLCFLAGFSERLVPDVISRLTAAAERAK